MRRGTVAVLLAVLPLLTGCASARATSSDDAAVRAAMSRFMDALNALDADRIMASFAEDATAFVPLAQGDRVDGKAAIGAIFRRYTEDTKKTISATHIVPQDLRVDLAGDTAVVTFNVRSPQTVARRTFVFRRQGDHWLITHMHASNFRLTN